MLQDAHKWRQEKVVIKTTKKQQVECKNFLKNTLSVNF